MAEMLKPEEILKERLNHPLSGPFIWAFCVINWEALIWLLGAVAKPDAALVGIGSWLEKSTKWNLLILPALFTSVYIFAGPFLVRLYQQFLDSNARNRYRDKLVSEKKGVVDAETFNKSVRLLKIQHEKLQQYHQQEVEASEERVGILYHLGTVNITGGMDPVFEQNIRSLYARLDKNLRINKMTPLPDWASEIESLRVKVTMASDVEAM